MAKPEYTDYKRCGNCAHVDLPREYCPLIQRAVYSGYQCSDWRDMYNPGGTDIKVARIPVRKEDDSWQL